MACQDYRVEVEKKPGSLLEVHRAILSSDMVAASKVCGCSFDDETFELVAEFETELTQGDVEKLVVLVGNICK